MSESDINIDLFKLNLPNLKEIISEILKNDNVDKFVKLYLELRTYRQLVYKKKYKDYINDIKKLKKQWRWTIKLNLKSDSCKILRIIIFLVCFNGIFIHCLKKMSKNFTEKQRLHISDVILQFYKYGDSKVLKSLIVEPSIKKIATIDELDDISSYIIHNSCEVTLKKSWNNLNHVPNRKRQFKFEILQDSIDVNGMTNDLRHIYFDYIKDIIFLVY